MAFQTVAPDRIRALGEALAAAGYSERELAAALRLSDFSSFSPAHAPLYRRRLAGPPPLGTYARLFLLADPIPVADVEQSLPPEVIETIVAGGMVRVDGDRVRPEVRITPMGDLLFVHDVELAGRLRWDHVAGIGPATRTLASLTVRNPADAVLDVGTGCGVHALLAARHARQVVATDINPRALAMAAFNASLNGIDNVEVRQGSFLEPVQAHERFDLVAVNPPFVISPDSEMAFRDAGLPGNVAETLVPQVAEVLGESGYAHILVNWVVGRDGDWESAPRRWVAGSGCDAWLLHYQTDDTLTYSSRWNLWVQGVPEDYEAALDRWLAYYEANGIERIATGAITLRRRRSGAQWWRADEIPLGPRGAAGSQVLRVFDAQDLLATLPEENALLNFRFAFAASHALDQTLRHTGGTYRIEGARIRLDEGVGVLGPVAPEAIQLLLTLDGRRTLAEHIQDVADHLGAVDREAFVTAVLQTVRRLYELGIVTLHD